MLNKYKCMGSATKPDQIFLVSQIRWSFSYKFQLFEFNIKSNIKNFDHQKKSTTSPKHPNSHTPRFQSGRVRSRSISKMIIMVTDQFLMVSSNYNRQKVYILVQFNRINITQPTVKSSWHRLSSCTDQA